MSCFSSNSSYSSSSSPSWSPLPPASLLLGYPQQQIDSLLDSVPPWGRLSCLLQPSELLHQSLHIQSSGRALLSVEAPGAGRALLPAGLPLLAAVESPAWPSSMRASPAVALSPTIHPSGSNLWTFHSWSGASFVLHPPGRSPWAAQLGLCSTTLGQGPD